MKIKNVFSPQRQEGGFGDWRLEIGRRFISNLQSLTSHKIPDFLFLLGIGLLLLGYLFLPAVPRVFSQDPTVPTRTPTPEPTVPAPTSNPTDEPPPPPPNETLPPPGETPLPTALPATATRAATAVFSATPPRQTPLATATPPASATAVPSHTALPTATWTASPTASQTAVPVTFSPIHAEIGTTHPTATLAATATTAPLEPLPAANGSNWLLGLGLGLLLLGLILWLVRRL